MGFKDAIGLGVAGNFAGHLEQAGESADFVNIKTKDESAPKGIFPFYLPNHASSPLSIYPLSSNIAKIPQNEKKVQLEPEIAILFDIVYSSDGTVNDLLALSFGAYNDCSIRREGAKKISHKKNWGRSSKGITKKMLPIDSFSYGSLMDDYKIASFLIRDGKFHRYGLDSYLLSYSYFYDKLKVWLINQINTQEDDGPLENISKLLEECNRPKRALISIGATKYTPYGESTFLEEGDEVIVVTYPSTVYHYEEIERIVAAKGCITKPDISVLYQSVTTIKLDD